MRLEQSKSSYWAYVKAGLVFTAFVLAKTTGFLPDLRRGGIMEPAALTFDGLSEPVAEQPLSPILLDSEIIIDTSVAKAARRRLLQITSSTAPVKQPPQLVNALPNQTAVVDKPFSFEIPLDAFQDPQGEAIRYLASRFNSSDALPQWLQFNSSSRQFAGTPSVPEVVVVNVTAVNLWLLSISTHFTITVSQSGNHSGSSSRNWIIAAVLPETVLILIYCILIPRRRAAEKAGLHAELIKNPEAGKISLRNQKETVRMEEVIPVAIEIANRVKITGYWGYTEFEVTLYKEAVHKLLRELAKQRVNLQFSTLQTDHKNTLINTIVTQTQHHFVPQQHCYTNCLAFFKAQLDPIQLEDVAPTIAQAIVKTLLELPDGQKTFFYAQAKPAPEIKVVTKSSEPVSLWIPSNSSKESKVRLSVGAMLSNQNQRKSKDTEIHYGTRAMGLDSST